MGAPGAPNHRLKWLDEHIMSPLNSEAEFKAAREMNCRSDASCIQVTNMNAYASNNHCRLYRIEPNGWGPPKQVPQQCWGDHRLNVAQSRFITIQYFTYLQVFLSELQVVPGSLCFLFRLWDAGQLFFWIAQWNPQLIATGMPAGLQQGCKKVKPSNHIGPWAHTVGSIELKLLSELIWHTVYHIDHHGSRMIQSDASENHLFVTLCQDTLRADAFLAKIQS